MRARPVTRGRVTGTPLPLRKNETRRQNRIPGFTRKALARGREPGMSVKRNNKMSKEDSALFQKATEAMRLLGEKPDAARGFLDAIKKGNFSEARMSLNASLERRR